MSDEPAKILLGDTAISSIEGPPSKRGIFRRKKREQITRTHCENCGAELHGHWCSQCGQAAVDYHRSFRYVIWDMLDAFLNWDSKFFASIGLLIAQPWRLTNDFVAGKRMRYFHPLRLYLLASILFFFAATYGIKSSHFDPINLSPAQRMAVRDALQRHNVAPETRAKFEQALGGQPIGPKKRAKLEKELAETSLPKEAHDAIADRLQYGELPPDARNKIEEAMKELPADARAEVESALKQPLNDAAIFQTDKDDERKQDAWEAKLEKRAREKFGEHGTNIQLFLLTLMSNLPYMMFVCIPLFALVLKVLYIRRGVFYINHLIYALHIHTFAYLGIMLAVLGTIGLQHLPLGALRGWIVAALWVAFSVEVLLSVRKVYRQGWFISILKFVFGGAIYLTVLFAALLATFIITIALP